MDFDFSVFSDVNHQISEEVSLGNIMVQPITLSSSTVSIGASSSVTSSPRDDTCYGEPQLGAPRYGDDEGVELGMDEPALEKAGTDMENIAVRSNQEVSEKQFLAPKVWVILIVPFTGFSFKYFLMCTTRCFNFWQFYFIFPFPILEMFIIKSLTWIVDTQFLSPLFCFIAYIKEFANF